MCMHMRTWYRQIMTLDIGLKHILELPLLVLLIETRPVFVTADACRDNGARGGNSNRPLLRPQSPRDYLNFSSH
jgi:hypothetical protein